MPVLMILLMVSFLVPNKATTQISDGKDLPVTNYRLANGMEFIILERSGSPTVSFVLQYKVGGINDKMGSTGTAHLLEHLLFKGTDDIGTLDAEKEKILLDQMDLLEDSIIHLEKNSPSSPAIDNLKRSVIQLEDRAQVYVASNEFERIFSRNGARGLNASTDSESTKYYLELPSNRTELWFMLESERMNHPVFREFYTERDVVAEERRLRVDNQPGNLLYEAHLRTAFTTHPYGEPVVGIMDDIQNLTRKDVKSHYQQYYGPDNAVVAIVGDVKTESVKQWANKYFGHITPIGFQEKTHPVEPLQRQERRVSLAFEAEPQLRIGWHTVETTHPLNPSLLVLSALLTGNRSSRLFQRLVVDDRTASNVSSSLGPGDLFPKLFSISVNIQSPSGTEQVEKAIYDELGILETTPPSERELIRIRNQISAGQIRRLSNNFDLAIQLAHSTAMFGNWKYGFSLAQELKKVTPEMISQVVRKFLTAENRTVATLISNKPAIR